MEFKAAPHGCHYTKPRDTIIEQKCYAVHSVQLLLPKGRLPLLFHAFTLSLVKLQLSDSHTVRDPVIGPNNGTAF